MSPIMEEQTTKPKALMVSPELHASILRVCPDGYKIRFFVERLLKGALAEEIKKQKAKK